MAVLERWWPSWSVGGRPGALVAVLERWWPSWSVGGRPGALVAILASSGQAWHRSGGLGIVLLDMASLGRHRGHQDVVRDVTDCQRSRRIVRGGHGIVVRSMQP